MIITAVDIVSILDDFLWKSLQLLPPLVTSNFSIGILSFSWAEGSKSQREIRSKYRRRWKSVSNYTFKLNSSDSHPPPL